MMTSKMTITDIVKAYPKSIELFNDCHIDYCCGGKQILEEALMELKIDVDSFIELLNTKLADANEIQESKQRLEINRLMELEVPKLIDYIIETHHEKERNLLAEIDQLINKVLFVHYAHHNEQLVPLHSLFSDLRKELQQHFAKEEKVMFPYMKENYLNKKQEGYVKELEDEHEAAGAIIKKIEAVTNNFTAPKDGCRSYQLTFQKLKELVEDIYIHIFTENSILFPKYEGGVA